MPPSASLRVLLCLCVGAACGAVACRSQPASPPVAAVAFSPTAPRSEQPAGPAPKGMVRIPGGEFSMGSESAADSLCDRPGVTRDAPPIHRVSVDGFWMDAPEVTNEQFAERAPDPAEFPGAPRALLVPGSAVVTPTDRPVDLGDAMQSWRYVPRADWRHPTS